jgi:hypothetical protein
MIGARYSVLSLVKIKENLKFSSENLERRIWKEGLCFGQNVIIKEIS